MKIHHLVKDPTGFIHHWVPDFELVFFNEQNFSFIQRSMKNWWWLSIPFAFVYIITVFLGRSWMSKKTEKYELRRELILWNTILSLFSLWGAYRCVPELIHALTEHGFRYSVCNSTYIEGITGLW